MSMLSGRCKQCNQCLVEIDNYGERLIGCIECNRWTWRGSKRAIELPDDDLEALKAVASRERTNPLHKGFSLRAAPSNEFDSGGEKMLHLVFASVVIVIVANVVAIIVIAATLTRLRKMTLGRNPG